MIELRLYFQLRIFMHSFQVLPSRHLNGIILSVFGNPHHSFGQRQIREFFLEYRLEAALSIGLRDDRAHVRSLFQVGHEFLGLSGFEHAVSRRLLVQKLKLLVAGRLQIGVPSRPRWFSSWGLELFLGTPLVHGGLDGPGLLRLHEGPRREEGSLRRDKKVCAGGGVLVDRGVALGLAIQGRPHAGLFEGKGVIERLCDKAGQLGFVGSVLGVVMSWDQLVLGVPTFQFDVVFLKLHGRLRIDHLGIRWRMQKDTIR